MSDEQFPKPIPFPQKSLPYTAPRNRDDIARGRASRCCHPPAEGVTRAWVDYLDPSHEEAAELRAWLASQAPAVRLDYLTRIRLRLDQAEAGTINPNENGEPIKGLDSHPPLFELRWDLDGTALRQYHGEPAAAPSGAEALVLVHMHLKVDRPRRPMSQAQSASIAFAESRYAAWKRSP